MKHFPNGFTSWIETHHEVVLALNYYSDIQLTYAYQCQLQKGRGGIYELAEELTDEFESSVTYGDGEFYDALENFLEIKMTNKSTL
jgi:hypothetical protein